jgi:hypothetical protein
MQKTDRGKGEASHSHCIPQGTRRLRRTDLAQSLNASLNERRVITMQAHNGNDNTNSNSTTHKKTKCPTQALKM